MTSKPRVVDLRSDTITKPTDEMREAMRSAEVGDDYYGEDSTVKRLEALSAERVGKESAVFMPSGTMVNQAAIFVHSQRWGEIIAEQTAHIVTSEGGAPAILSGVMVRGLPGVRGVFNADQVRGAIRGETVLQPRTRLIAIENTHNRSGGNPWTVQETRAVADVGRERGIPVHLDGARIFNAAVALGVPATKLTADVDTVAFCFSKGLSAPFGSVLCGPSAFIKEARRARQVMGGGMRQAGIMAAAAIVGLEKMVDRLREDHAKARTIAEGLARVPGIGIDVDAVRTNILIFDVSGLGLTARGFCDRLAQEGIRCLPRDNPVDVRMVTNRHVSAEDAKFVVDTVRRVFVETRKGSGVVRARP